MKKSYQFFAWIILMVLALIIVLVITQINGSRSVDRLVKGNKQATATFVINNRIEEMVNLSFELESKILTEKPDYLFKNRPGIADSVNKLIQKADQLEKIMHDAGISSSLEKIITLVNRQTALSSAILSSENNSLLLDSLGKKHFGDSIYVNSLAFQIELERSLSATLRENNHVVERVSWLNKLLAFTALLAVLLLATIIIRRQVMQFLLIRDLEQARKLALQSVKIKDQFLANMSHEIRTPLNALKGFSNLLSKTTLDEEQQQYSSIISNSSESLLHIVNDILDLSKIEAGALAIKSNSFSLHALLKDLEITYATLAAEKNLNFTLDVGADVENNLTGDPERLKQVLINLISNAIKFTNEGFIFLRVSLSGKDEETTAIRFSVEDTGIGIPADKRDLIFERFEQLDNAFIRQQGGTGLGLAISKMIIESMGGHIIVNSEPGKGSTFSFTIHFKINKQAVLNRELQMQRVARIVKDPSQNSILLAEDNKVNQLLVHKLLAPYNIQPVIAENGEEVLNLLENKSFDLILMDVQMPLLDGITTTRLIRKYVANRIPIVGMTAYVLPNEIEKCYAAGMNDHIPKPIDEQHLLEVIKKYIYLDENGTGTTLSAALAPTAVTENIAAIDLEFLSNICNANQASMNTILDALEAQLPVDSHSFEQALANNDPEALRKIIHHMKSTVSPLGTGSVIAKAIITVSDHLHTGNDWPAVQESGRYLLSALENTIDMIKKR